MMGIGATDRWGAMTVRRVTGGWNPGPGEPEQEPLALWRRWLANLAPVKRKRVRRTRSRATPRTAEGPPNAGEGGY